MPHVENYREKPRGLPVSSFRPSFFASHPHRCNQNEGGGGYVVGSYGFWFCKPIKCRRSREGFGKFSARRFRRELAIAGFGRVSFKKSSFHFTPEKV